MDALEKLPLKDGTERPAKSVKVTEVKMFVLPVRSLDGGFPDCVLHRYQDPFEDYKTRLAKKLAKRAEAEQNGQNPQETEKRAGDDMNWFGVKVGSETTTSATAGGGVGKYLNLKRPAVTGTPDEPPKKRKLGFGNFENF